MNLEELIAFINRRTDIWATWTHGKIGMNVGTADNLLAVMTVTPSGDRQYLVSTVARAELIDRDAFLAFLQGFMLRDSLTYWEH